MVSGAFLAETGNHVVCVDVADAKVDRLNNGDIPIDEPGLEAHNERNVIVGRLEFTTDLENAVAHGLFQFIAVGTPPDEDGSADLQHVLAVAGTIGERVTEYRIIVDKSTVPVGTADKVKAEIRAALDARNEAIEHDVVSNPDFLKEWAAIDDLTKPDRIVSGVPVCTFEPTIPRQWRRPRGSIRAATRTRRFSAPLMRRLRALTHWY